MGKLISWILRKKGIEKFLNSQFMKREKWIYIRYSKKYDEVIVATGDNNLREKKCYS